MHINKWKVIVIIIGLIIIFSVLIYSLTITSNTISIRSSDNSLDRECAQLLETVNFKGSLTSSTEKICKITSGILNKKIQEVQPNESIKPGDRIILSVNLPNIMAKPQNIFTQEEIEKPKDDTYALCFVAYPNLIQTQYIGAEKVKAFYQNDFWQMVSNKTLEISNRGDNYICTKPLSIEAYSKISFLLTIPPEKLLKLGDANSRSYGVKIVLIPQTNADLSESLKNISLNIFDNDTDGITPIYLYLKPISFQ
jgi:hypothetical protein